ncbi:MAG: nucleoside triphosphate pyrophosphohydrolase [Thiolinea sp.]
MEKTQSPEMAIHTLLKVMAQLRDPESGCPWDIKQSWQTIIPHTLEEVYEVADAVDRNDAEALRDELGDLLFQVVFMAQIAKDQGLFDFNDVAQGIADKMIRRHPHIFDDAVYGSEAEQKQAWEEIKQQERTQKRQQDFFADIPATMPALRRSQKIQKRAARVGFDWDDWRLVIPKVQEELDEVREAVENNEPFERIEEEVGDVLMGASNLARQLKVDAENALRLSNNKFERRFLAVEQDLAARGISLEDADLETMEAAWGRVKQAEKMQ